MRGKGRERTGGVGKERGGKGKGKEEREGEGRGEQRRGERNGKRGSGGSCLKYGVVDVFVNTQVGTVNTHSTYSTPFF